MGGKAEKTRNVSTVSAMNNIQTVNLELNQTSFFNSFT